MKKLIVLLPLLAGSWAYAAEPQAAPLQCVLPEQGGSAKVGKDGSFDLEKCLIKAGNKNFSRKGKVLTVFLANGKKETFKNLKAGGEGGDYGSEYHYLGYDPQTGLHRIDDVNSYGGGDTFIDHESGVQFNSSAQFGFSPDRQWVLETAGDGTPEDSCSYPDLAMHKLPKRGQAGEVIQVSIKGLSNKNQTNADSYEVCRKPSDNLFEDFPVKAQWLDSERVQVDWEGRKNGNDNTLYDSILLTLQGGQWVANRQPFSGKQTTHKATAISQSQSNALRTGMTLEEVEKILGRSADRFKINPLALLGKQEITRVWTANGRQFEVTFVGGVVSSWR